jgi:hypothetical protein
VFLTTAVGDANGIGYGWGQTRMASTAHNRGPDQRRGVGRKSTRIAASWLAWSFWALSLILMGLGLELLVLNLSRPSAHVHNYLTLTHTRGPNPLLAIGFSTVGALVASRFLPANPIGWLFCAVGFLFVVDHFADAVAHERSSVRLCCTECDGAPRVYGGPS